MSIDFELNTTNVGTVEQLEKALSDSLNGYAEFIKLPRLTSGSWR